MRDIKKMLMFYMSLIDNDDDRAKFEMLYNEYRKRMVYIAYSVLGNNEDAEDAVHDTFIKIARNMNSIGDPKSNEALSYVLKATKNTAINLSQKNTTRNKHIHLEDVENIPDEQFLEKLRIQENYEEVVNAIRSLDDTYRDVLFYHFVESMKIKDIADLLDRNKSTVQQQIIRGKKKLLEILENDLRD